jgi:hypothetical protein
MFPSKRSTKTHAKARQRRRLTAQERLERDCRQAQHAAKLLEQALHDLGLPDGLVASLAQPVGNTTGVSLMLAELPGKRLELLKETVPQSTRVAVLANPAFEVYPLYLHNLTLAARALGLHLGPVKRNL